MKEIRGVFLGEGGWAFQLQHLILGLETEAGIYYNLLCELSWVRFLREYEFILVFWLWAWDLIYIFTVVFLLKT